MLFLVRDYGALWKSLKSILHSLAVVRGNFCCFTNATIRSNLTGFSTLKTVHSTRREGAGFLARKDRGYARNSAVRGYFFAETEVLSA